MYINEQDISGAILKSASEKFPGLEMKNLLDKYKLKADQSEAECKKAADLLSAFETVRNGSASVAVKSENGQQLSASSIESIQMGFPSKASTNGHQADLLTAFSYLVLSSAFESQLKDLNRTEPASEKQIGKAINYKQMLGTTVIVKEIKSKPDDKKQQNKATPKTKDNSLQKPTNVSGPNNAKPEKHVKPQQFKPQQPKTSTNNKKPQQFKPQQTRLPMSSKHAAHQSHENLSSVSNLNTLMMAPLPAHLLTAPPPLSLLTGPPIDLKGKKVWMTFALNGQTYGHIAFELRPDVAPIMCQKFTQTCISRESPYIGTIIYQASRIIRNIVFI